MMSVMENNSTPNPACTVVHMEPADILSLAGQFVVQYYTFLRKCPSGIHRFYKDDSSMIREDAPVFGQRMIHDKIMSMNLQDTRVAILRLDALRANGNSVLIQEHITTWENSPSDEAYKHGNVEVHEDKLDQCEVNQIPTEHTAPSPCPSNVVSSPVPDSGQSNVPTSTQGRSWAQMASKPPSQAALNMQNVKTVRNVSNVPDYQMPEDHIKPGIRQQSGGGHFGNQRPRGMGGRQQQSDGRGVSGDGIFNQDNRVPGGQGSMRGGGLTRGGPRGPRGNRGMGNGPNMGRGGGVNNMGQRRA